MAGHRSGTVMLIAGLLIGGCSNSELQRKDDEIAELAERWQRAERELAASNDRTSRLRDSLKQAQGESAVASDQLRRTTEVLSQSKEEQALLSSKVKTLEERNYELEMAYGSLVDQIREFKNQLSVDDERLMQAKQAIRESKEELKRRADEHTKTMDGAVREAEALKSDSQKLRGDLDSLRGEIEKARERNQVLERQAAQLEVVRAEAVSLAAEKKSLEALNHKSQEQARRLEARLASLTSVAQTAGVSLPADLEAPSDWEVLKQMTTTRFRLAAAGRLQGDIVDGVLFGGLAVGALLLLTAVVATIVAVRSRRRLRRLLAAGGDRTEAQMIGAYAGEEEVPPDDGGEYDEAQGPELAASGAETTEEEPASWDEAGSPFSPSSDRRVPVTLTARPAEEPEESEESEESGAVDRELTEVLSTVGAEPPSPRSIAGARSSLPEENPDLSRTQIIDQAFSPLEKKQKPKQSSDEDILGDLRSVINKKFDELLEG